MDLNKFQSLLDMIESQIIGHRLYLILAVYYGLIFFDYWIVMDWLINCDTTVPKGIRKPPKCGLFWVEGGNDIEDFSSPEDNNAKGKTNSFILVIVLLKVINFCNLISMVS